MRFLLDVCASSRRLRAALADLRFDAVSAATIDPRASDESLLALALAEDRILITEDKDFGELVFARGLPHGTIIRFVDMGIGDQLLALRELLDRHGNALQSKSIITVTPGRIRIRC